MAVAPRAPMRRALLFLVLLPACSAPPPDEEQLGVGQTAEPLTAVCEANVTGVGTIPVETQYLPHVVHCENGGAPLEALRVQAIAARTYLYYKMETSGAIGDGQGDQVYSCGSGPDAQQIQAVKDTEGLVLRYSNTTIASFFVAGGAASPPACRGGAASTEGFVTYNEGLSGASIHQTTLGFVSPSNYRNRGCMSQLGSRCLANEGKSYQDILKFYYGADIVIERATGPCVTQPAPDAGADATAHHDAAASDGAHAVDGNGNPSPDGAGPQHGDAASPAPESDAAPGNPASVPQDPSGCSASPAGARSASAAWPIAVALALALRRRRPALTKKARTQSS